MGSFVIRDYKFIYADESEEILLDLSDPFANKGRIPFNSGLTDITIPNLISLNMENHEQYCGENTGLLRYEPYFTIMDILLIREHIKTKYPKTILEYGNNDVLVSHYLTILNHLHPETKYIVRKNDKLNEPQDKVDADMIFINGTDIIRNPNQVIDAVVSNSHRNTFICAFIIGQEELCNIVRNTFVDGKEYRLNDNAIIYTTEFAEEK